VCPPGDRAVRAQGDLEALLIHPGQISALDSEELLFFGIILAVGLDFLKVRQAHRDLRAVPTRLDSALRSASMRLVAV
jgi:hypothetical protein